MADLDKAIKTGIYTQDGEPVAVTVVPLDLKADKATDKGNYTLGHQNFKAVGGIKVNKVAHTVVFNTVIFRYGKPDPVA